VSDLGVVDPIRMPTPFVDFAARLRALPKIAQLFVVLAVADALVRTIGLIEPAARLDDGAIAFITSYLPRDGWILLPAILLLRRPTGADDTPTLFRGTLLIAAVTLIAQPTMALLTARNTEPDLGFFAGLNVLRSLAVASAYVLLGSGLARLNPREPRPTTAGLANLVVVGIVGALVLQLTAALAFNLAFGSEPLIDAANIAGLIISQLALAAFLRAIVRGLGDPSRTERATTIASAGAVLLALSIAIEGVLSIFAAFAQGITALQPALIDISQSSSTALAVVDVAGFLLLLAGFAFGLADPLRPMARDWDAAGTGVEA
jgi:hypothetical protein